MSEPRSDYPLLEGVARTSPSTLYMDGTSPVTVKVQATTDDLRAIHGKRVRLVVVGDDIDRRPDDGGDAEMTDIDNLMLGVLIRESNEARNDNRTNYLLALSWVLDNWRSEDDPVRRRLALYAEGLDAALDEPWSRQAAHPGSKGGPDV